MKTYDEIHKTIGGLIEIYQKNKADVFDQLLRLKGIRLSFLGDLEDQVDNYDLDCNRLQSDEFVHDGYMYRAALNCVHNSRLKMYWYSVFFKKYPVNKIEERYSIPISENEFLNAYDSYLKEGM